MKALVTGVAGFIGAALARQLLKRGDRVIGIDCFLDAYPRFMKDERLQDLLDYANFSMIEDDISTMDLKPVVAKVDNIYHLAAQAGVRSSWGERFETYTRCNILGTQRLLEAAREGKINRFVYASSSSVYGNAEFVPTSEDAVLKPISPYAVSKLAGEHLCHLYYKNYRLPVVMLRYFTVYGPQPRPDQAVAIFSHALLEDRPILIFGDGEQLRGMTYVDDVVRANLLASQMDCVGEALNIGGGTSITVNELIGHIEKIIQKKAQKKYIEAVKGDARHTLADISKARQILLWEPETEIFEGLKNTIYSIRKIRTFPFVRSA
jgi:UDP-glucose 4-epimerase